MSESGLLSEPLKVKMLAERLAAVPRVAQLNEGDEREGDSLAYNFSELEESFRAFLDSHLPRLCDPGASADDIHDLLIEIGEEFRHILYHLREPQFYRYLFT